MGKENNAAFGIGDIAAPVIGGVISALGIGEKRQDRRQIEQQKKLNEMDMVNAERMRNLQMKTWHETNYGAQMKEAKDAGLSMSIFGKGGGSSGATMGTPSTTNSGNAANAAQSGQTALSQGMAMAQLGLMKAQKENIEADTANKTAGAGNINVKTEGDKIDVGTKKETQKDNIRLAAMTAEDKALDVRMKTIDNEIQRATSNDEIKKIKANAIGAELENAATKQGINLDKARINEIAVRLEQEWEALRNQGKSIEASKENMDKLTDAMLWSAGINATGNLIKSIGEIGARNKSAKMGTRTTTTNTKGESSVRTTRKIN